jgi:Uma2 family endonuclease
MSAQPQPRLTPEQYLEMERAAEWRNEFYDGRMLAMPHSSMDHAVIKGNLSCELGNALKQTPWTVVVNMRIQVCSSGFYAHPDVLAVRGAKLEDAHEDTLLNPTFLAEVLSPSTEAYDRGFKSAQYRTIESLQESALVSQAEPRVEVFRRQSGADGCFPNRPASSLSAVSKA